MQHQRDKKFIYPWRDNNAFQLFIDGENYFPRIIELVDNASHFIIIEQYLVESGKITTQLIDHLTAAAQRGIHIMLLFDDYGSQALSNSDRQRLDQNSIQLFFYNPLRIRNWHLNLVRNHRKFICIDGKFGFTGGAGFTDDFETDNKPQGWHDILLQISGPILTDWLLSFTKIWSQYAEPSIDLEAAGIASETEKNMPGRLTIADTPLHQEISRSLINQIQHSKHIVWLATPYFVATRKLRREIKRAALHGIDVRLLLPGTQSDHPWVTHAYRYYYNKLLRSGVRIFEYQPRFLHAKVLICDQWVSIGSSNLDRWNRRWSMDANQEIDDGIFANKVKNFFENDFSQSHEILLAEWNKRGKIQQLKENLCQKIVFILDSLGNLYRN